MDKIKSLQMVPEQRQVLDALARRAAKENPRFLELGSWAGDSTTVLGRVASELGGTLYCVDWWQGNEGTPLKGIAESEDVFAHFWKRVCETGLQDTVIPIRTSTDNAVALLKHLSFDLIFIDADHRYESVLRDIQNYAPLVKKGHGILCGHDCEGFLSDYDAAFLKRGKDRDCYQSVHCGVVLAVGSVFKDYAIDYSIWSVRRKNTKGTSWEATALEIPHLEKAVHLPQAPFAHSMSYNIFRHGRQVFAVPKTLINCDLTRPDTLPDAVKKAKSMKTLEQSIGEPLRNEGDEPVLVETYQKFNLISYRNEIIAVHHSLGPMELTKLSDAEIEKYRKSEKFLSGNFLEEVRAQIDYLTPHLVEESYKDFNIVLYKGRYHAVAQKLGPIFEWAEFDFTKPLVLGSYFVLDSLEEARRIIDSAYEEQSSWLNTLRPNLP